MENYLSEEKLSDNDIMQKLGQNKLWIVGILLIMAGVAIGLLLSPATKGVSITLGSNNHLSNSGDTALMGMTQRNSCQNRQDEKNEKEQKCC